MVGERASAEAWYNVAGSSQSRAKIVDARETCPLSVVGKRIIEARSNGLLMYVCRRSCISRCKISHKRSRKAVRIQHNEGRPITNRKTYITNQECCNISIVITNPATRPLPLQPQQSDPIPAVFCMRPYQAIGIY